MKNNPYSGKFIAVEGLDGSGQTTQVALLKDFLEKNGNREVITTKEPTTDSEAGRKIREILDEKAKIESAELQKLFTQDRKEHLEGLVIPELKKGKIIISDRYCFSTFAFGVSDGLDLNWLIALNEKFLLPDLTIILKVAPRICIERIEKRGEGRKLFEKEKKLEKVWETYAILADYFPNLYVVNGQRSQEEVFAEIKPIVCSKLNIKED